MSRRRSATSPSTFGLSLLDLLSCAFAGVIVLAVVMSALLGSRRIIEERSFLVLDVTLAAPQTSDRSSERLEAIDHLVIGLQIESRDWTALWVDGVAVQPIRDPNVQAQVLAGRSDKPGRPHFSLILQGVAPGRYRTEITVNDVKEGFWSPYRQHVVRRPLEAQVEIRHAGGQGISKMITKPVELPWTILKTDLILSEDE